MKDLTPIQKASLDCIMGHQHRIGNAFVCTPCLNICKNEMEDINE